MIHEIITLSFISGLYNVMLTIDSCRNLQTSFKIKFDTVNTCQPLSNQVRILLTMERGIYPTKNCVTELNPGPACAGSEIMSSLL